MERSADCALQSKKKRANLGKQNCGKNLLIFRVPRQSLCRKFQIIWGFSHPAIPLLECMKLNLSVQRTDSIVFDWELYQKPKSRKNSWTRVYHLKVRHYKKFSHIPLIEVAGFRLGSDSGHKSTLIRPPQNFYASSCCIRTLPLKYIRFHETGINGVSYDSYIFPLQRVPRTIKSAREDLLCGRTGHECLRVFAFEN